MQNAAGTPPNFTAQEGWRTIHATMAQAHSSLYLSGTAYILLLWGVITSMYFFTLFAIGELSPGFEASYPWYRGPLWGVLGTLGMIGSALIGRYAGLRNADHATARSAGLRVFAFWMAVVTAAFLIPAAAGLWSSGRGYEHSSCRHRNRVPRLCAVRHNAPPGARCCWSGHGRGILYPVLPRG